MPNVLLVDDDRKLSDSVSEFLGRRGFEVTKAYDGQSALDAFDESPFDAVILDLMLPDMDGFDVCREIRARAGTPILMLTARGDDEDRIVGLELGADDYVGKPFNPRELLARLRAVLRRSSSSQPRHEAMLRFGRLEIDCGARTVKLDGDACPLTSHQFEILRTLAENPGEIVSRERLLRRLGSDDREGLLRSVDVHISRIRALIEDDPRNPRRILTVRGMGYVFPPSQA